MSRETRATIVLVTLFLTAVSHPLLARGIEVRQPGGADVSKHSTYGWMATPGRVEDNPLSPESPQGQALRTEVEAALRAKGYAPSDDPEFRIRLNGVMTDSYDFSGKSDHVSSRVVWEYEGSGAKQSAEGILVLEALDPAGEKLLWAGIGRAKFSGTQSPDKTLKKAQGVLKKILKEFPAR